MCPVHYRVVGAEKQAQSERRHTMHEQPKSPEFLAAIAALAGIMLDRTTMNEVLERASHIVKHTLRGAAEVSVTVQNGRPVTAASSGLLALQVDQAQYAAGYGPCLDAIRLDQTITVDDQATDPRWPDYRPHALEAGVASSVSVPLLVDQVASAALNIYALRPQAFPANAVTDLQAFASYAAVILNNAGLYYAADARADGLTEAMKSRATIEQAKGILMGGRRINADEAFQILVGLSQRSGRKLHHVAQALVDEAAAS